MPSQDHKLKILITDGASVNALGIIRQLGILNKFEIHVVGYNSLALGKYSRYCNDFTLVSHPKQAPEKFISSIIKLVEQKQIDFVLPVGFYAHKVLIENSTLFNKRVKFCLPSQQSFENATSKIKTAELAQKVKVNVPKTIVITDVKELDQLSGLKYPVVIKAAKEIGGRMVEYAENHAELLDKFKYLVHKFNLSPQDYPIIQEYIKGEGVGFFALYSNGVCQHYFMHERIREFPVSGGRSVCARSFYDERLFEEGKKILDALNWNGSAMVEFKRTAENEYYLLEVNPKLWGSIELAIVSGVNFPLLMIDHVNGIDHEPIQYKRGVYFQWCLNGEFYHFVNRPLAFFKILTTSFSSKKDFWLKDIKPNLIQSLLIIVDLYKVIRAKI